MAVLEEMALKSDSPWQTSLKRTENFLCDFFFSLGDILTETLAFILIQWWYLRSNPTSSTWIQVVMLIRLSHKTEVKLNWIICASQEDELYFLNAYFLKHIIIEGCISHRFILYYRSNEKMDKNICMSTSGMVCHMNQIKLLR